jgi:hypothetical protein
MLHQRNVMFLHRRFVQSGVGPTRAAPVTVVIGALFVSETYTRNLFVDDKK